MSSLVIVAIPEQDDFAWQVSSEKVPHITLLFLGDADANPNSEEIVKFVEHAATTISPFYMDTDYRGTLGEDNADVIFFEKGWDFKSVSAFRDHLLTNSYIKLAYNSAEQFPEWTPHLTLGYPATPAKTPEKDRRIHAVSFDRIAVWFGDFDGPEFRLKHNFHDREEVSMTSMSREEADELLHFGVKGMKWGVTRTNLHTKNAAKANARLAKAETRSLKTGPGASSRSLGLKNAQAKATAANKAVARDASRPERRAEQKAKLVAGRKTVGRGLKAAPLRIADAVWESGAYSSGTAVQVHNGAANKLNDTPGLFGVVGGVGGKPGAITKLNNSPKYRGKNLDADLDLKKEYHQDFAKVSDKAYRDSAKEVLGTNFSGTKKAVFVNDVNGSRIETRAIKAKHAAEDQMPDITILLRLDTNGQVVEANTAVLDTLEQGEEFVEGLFHYGVRGMKWGIRKAEPVGDGSVSVTTGMTKKGQATVSTTGGSGAGATKDATNAAKSRAILTKSGTNALSNKELRDLSDRIRLEKQIAELTAVPPSRGRKFVNTMLGNFEGVAQQQIRTVANDQAAVQVKKAMEQQGAKTPGKADGSSSKTPRKSRADKAREKKWAADDVKSKAESAALKKETPAEKATRRKKDRDDWEKGGGTL